MVKEVVKVGNELIITGVKQSQRKMLLGEGELLCPFWPYLYG